MTGEGLAVSGMEVVTALGVGCETNWSRLAGGDCGIRPMNRFPAGRYGTDVAGEIDESDFERMRDEVDTPDLSRAYLLATWVAQRALENSEVDREKTALVLATTKADMEDFEDAFADRAYPCARRFNPHVMAADLASARGLGGGVFAVSNACASGLVAIVQAARLLKRGQVDHVLVVGVDVLTGFVLDGFSCLRALSARPSRPFDAERDGLSLGEGAAALVVSRKDGPHEADPGEPRTRLLGWGVSNDAEHITAPSREGRGLRQAIESTLRMAGRNSDDIGYINAHGTGTVFNDEMECQAVTRVFDKDRQPPISSMKGAFGHTLGAAGVIEAVLTIEAMRAETIPPSTGYEALGVTEELNISKDARPSPGLRHALCMKSGFGGVNAVVSFGMETAS